jgi:Peptidase C10 family/Carboxypeptidase regulatory-like domain/Spi protease inhibitor
VIRTSFILAIGLVLAACKTSVMADPVSVDQVREMITGWRVLSDTPLEMPLSKQMESIQLMENTNALPLYYVVQLQPEGFILTAADDEIQPLIAFSATGSYEQDPCNPLTLLIEKDMQARLAGLPSGRIPKSTGTAAIPTDAQDQWTRFTDAALLGATARGSGITSVDDIRVPPLILTRWNQSTVGSPKVACYNYYTPPYEAGNPSNYVCGCTQTGWAQIMKYYQWPQDSIGVYTNTIEVNGVSTQRTTLGAAYDWDQMPNQPDASTPEAQRQAIGGLTYDLGVVNGASYASGGTFAGMSIYRLTGQFMYSNAKYAAPSFVGTTLSNLLTDVINANLDAGHVVGLMIDSDVGAHSIAGDGYGYNAGTLYHHLNLGWGGTKDAWYQLPDVDTDYYQFDSIMYVIYNLYTNGTGEIVSGRVVDYAGNPVAGAAVVIQSEGFTNSATSNDRGIYAFCPVPSETAFTLSATQGSLQFSSRSVTTGTSPNYGVTGNRGDINLVEEPTDYWIWASAIQNGLTNAEDCASGDTCPNLLKYAMGSHPTHSNQLSQMLIERSNAACLFQFERNTAATDLVLTVEGALIITNPSPWFGVATNRGGSWGGATHVQESGSNSPVTVTVSDPDPFSVSPSRYMRLRVERP